MAELSGLTPAQKNTILVYQTTGWPYEKYAEEQLGGGEDSPEPGRAKAFWEELALWIAQNPLQAGQSYAPVQE